MSIGRNIHERSALSILHSSQIVTIFNVLQSDFLEFFTIAVFSRMLLPLALLRYVVLFLQEPNYLFMYIDFGKVKFMVIHTIKYSFCRNTV